ncbi:MAG: GGDEF domain-containing protein [Nocardioides sp.]
MATVSRSVHQREAGLRLRTVTDAMTGLWNYSMFVELAERAFDQREEGETLALLFMDLDRFKQLNEVLGHFDADQVLCEIARRLQDTVPASASVARFAGDEFALLLRGVDPATVGATVKVSSLP